MKYEDALKKAANYCARYETCPFDLKNKLRQWKVPEEYHEKIITYLKENNFINEVRYAKSFVKDKILLNKWGLIKIRYALKQKQLPGNIINIAIEQTVSEEEYKHILREILLQKLKLIKNKISDPYKIKQKLFSFALSKGFEQDLVFEIGEEILNNTK